MSEVYFHGKPKKASHSCGSKNCDCSNESKGDGCDAICSENLTFRNGTLIAASENGIVNVPLEAISPFTNSSETLNSILLKLKNYNGPVDLSPFELQLEELSNSINALRCELDDKCAQIETRIRNVELKAATNENAIAHLQTTVNNLSVSQEDLETRVAANETCISELSSVEVKT